MIEEEKSYTPKEDEKIKRFESFKRELKDAIPEEREEKLKFLKREEIKTMEKDIKRLREMEAEKERERILALEKEKKKFKKEETVKKEEAVKKEIPKKREDFKKEFKEKIALVQQEKPVIPKPPKKPSSIQKFLVRIAIILIPFLLAAFIYWISTSVPVIKKKIPTPSQITPSEEQTSLEQTPKVPFPEAFVKIKNVLSFEVSGKEEVSSVFNLLSQKDLSQKQLHQVIIINKTQNRILNLEEIAQGFKIEIPSGLIQELDKENFNILIFPQEQGLREVFIIKIKQKEGLDKLLKEWELKLTKEGISLSGVPIQTIASSFKESSYKGKSFRYLTISKEDLGICYGLFDEYFVFTTSFESIQKIIDELEPKISPSPELSNKLGQLFIVGFEGKSLTPELEEFIKKYKPGGILLLSKNIESKEQLKDLINSLQDLSLKETGLPLFIAVDQEGGQVCRIEFLEEKTAQSEINNTDEAYNIGMKRGNELKELGINMNLAPLLDNMQAGDFYFNRSFKKSPEQSGELAKSLILGQKQAGLLTVIKHFPGYVNVPFNPETKLAYIPFPEISQFKKAMEAKPELVMIANAVYTDIDPSLPSTFSKKLIDYLKENLGEEIIIASDDLSQNSLSKNFSLKEIVTKPIEAGVDILILSGYPTPVEQALDVFFKAVENKEISETRLNEAINKVVQLKEAL